MSAPSRASRRPVDKFEDRRTELADAALLTLSEFGYARTSLREIAQNSAFSHGVLHYYFTDKVDLITHCVRQYKTSCVTRYDKIVATATTATELASEFALALATTMVEDASMHRLWYDLRNQSLFEEAFRSDVTEIDASLQRMIWRVVDTCASLAGITPSVSPEQAYAIFDGLFQHALLKHVAGDTDADADLQTGAARILALILPT